LDDTLATVNAMSWRDFSALLAEAFQLDGYLVKPLPGPAADLAVAKVGTHALVSGRRWKAAHQGIEPLRELAAAVQAHDEARQAVFVTAGALSDNALDYARSNSVQVLSGAALVQLLLPALRARKKPTVSPR
jgi:restriction system protein